MPPRKLPPKLPLSVLHSANAAAANASPTRVWPAGLIDAHVHLWDAELATSIGWLKGDALESSGTYEYDRWRRSIGEVQDGLQKVGQGAAARGLIFIQVEVDHDDADPDGTRGGWEAAIGEVSWISRCVPSDAQPPLLGIVPWAPVHAGPSALSAYLPRLDSAALPFIKGFRYLLQGPSVPGGAILQEPFVQGLKWCGERGYGFEVTVDCHNEGVEKLAQVVECITRVRAGQDPQKLTRFMICHLGKPDLAQSSSPRNASQSSFYSSFVASLFQLALLPDVSLKISGLLAEAPADLVRSAFAYYLSTQSKKEAVKSPTTAKPEAVQSDSAPQTPSGDREAYKELKKSIKVYLEPALEAFGDHRLVYGSDFPMYQNALGSLASGGPEKDAAAYSFGFNVLRECLVELGIRDEGLDNIFFANAQSWYAQK